MRSIGLLDEEDILDKCSKISYKEIIPNDGIYLGLDISKNSTGICLIEEGERVTGNITLSDELLEIQKSKNWCFQETLLRRYLKKYLLELIRDKEFDVILIEDAFSGENPKTTRMLYALNTAIDEIILDGECRCKEFRRVPNGTWKKWLWHEIDKEGKYTGLNDKVKIEECLRDIGIEEEKTFGYQDRLDATGMLIGYFLNKDKILEEDNESGIKINWSHLDFAYELDDSIIYEGNQNWLKDVPAEYIHWDGAVTKKAILKIINKSPSSLFISDEPVILGMLGSKLGLGLIDDGGYFAFWVKKRVRKKIFGDSCC